MYVLHLKGAKNGLQRKQALNQQIQILQFHTIFFLSLNLY